MAMNPTEKPPIASELILIACKDSTTVDPTLLGAMKQHFKSFEEAGTPLTGEQFILELANAYCQGYLPIIAEANMDCQDTFESAMEKFAPIDIELINCIIARTPFGIQLLTYLNDMVKAQIQLIETMTNLCITSSFGIRHADKLQTWRVILAKITLDSPKNCNRETAK